MVVWTSEAEAVTDVASVELPSRKPRRRRGKRKPATHPVCDRDGCGRPRESDYRYCSYACRRLNDELIAAQRMCQAVGHTEFSSRLWLAAVAAADAWSEYRRLAEDFASAALSVGITAEQLEAIKNG